MKKITLIMLVAIVPLMTIAQKRTKKNKDNAKNINMQNNPEYQFMIMHGSETTPPATIAGGNPGTTNVASPRGNAKKLRVSFDFGGFRFESAPILQETKYRSMAHALNFATRNGWELVDVNVVKTNGSTDHFCYMRKKR